MLYGMGDAQIDAQNRATSDIGAIKAQYNAVKAGGQLTADFINSTKSQIQTVVDNYKNGWSSTSRGKAGGDTLQNFVSAQIYPELANDLNGLQTPAILGPSAPVTDLNATPMLQPWTPGGSTNITIGGGSSQTPGSVQASGTPGPPAGITVPADAPPAPWYMNPLVWVAGGLGIMALLGKSSNR